MIAIPAIDLINGRCVRLTKGAFDTMQVYNDDPSAVAASFAEAGARRLHVVDLDAARGLSHNRNAIAAIRGIFPGILDVGGGVRRSEDAHELLSIGVNLVVVGTALIKNPDAVARWISTLGPMFIAGIDAQKGVVKTAGWQEGSTVPATTLAARVKDLGFSEIIYTDIAKDGTMAGPNVEETVAMAQISGLPVIISGGVGGMQDLQRLVELSPEGVKGVIFGKALYEGHIDLGAAVKLLGGHA